MLSPNQRRKNIASLKAEHTRLLKLEKEKAFANRPTCPYCNNNHIYAYGSNPGNNTRFKCAKCKKTFTRRSGTSLHYIHLRSKFQKYKEQMLTEGHKSLKKLSIEYNICILTAFDWRHKVLASINTSNKQLQGLIELRNSVFAYSRKGIHLSKNASKAPIVETAPVQLIIAADFNNSSIIELAKIGKLNLNDIENRLNNRLANNPVILSPENKAISDFGCKYNLALTQFNKKNNPKNINLKKADSLDIQLRTLVYVKARVVSTKYLHHYARWVIINSIGTITSNSINCNSAWPEYTQSENNYMDFCNTHSEIPHIRTSHRVWKTATKFA